MFNFVTKPAANCTKYWSIRSNETSVTFIYTSHNIYVIRNQSLFKGLVDKQIVIHVKYVTMKGIGGLNSCHNASSA